MVLLWRPEFTSAAATCRHRRGMPFEPGLEVLGCRSICAHDCLVAMQERGNLIDSQGQLCTEYVKIQDSDWPALWEAARAVPASNQVPLMDPAKEGERVLHWFEHSVGPSELWELLMPLALSAAAACLAVGPGACLPLASSELAWCSFTPCFTHQEPALHWSSSSNPILVPSPHVIQYLPKGASAMIIT